jgi:hypothetical protein
MAGPWEDTLIAGNPGSSSEGQNPARVLVTVSPVYSFAAKIPVPQGVVEFRKINRYIFGICLQGACILLKQLCYQYPISVIRSLPG